MIQIIGSVKESEAAEHLENDHQMVETDSNLENRKRKLNRNQWSRNIRRSKTCFEERIFQYIKSYCTRKKL